VAGDARELLVWGRVLPKNLAYLLGNSPIPYSGSPVAPARSGQTHCILQGYGRDGWAETRAYWKLGAVRTITAVV